jgi:hypothetical protein
LQKGNFKSRKTAFLMEDKAGLEVAEKSKLDELLMVND